MQLRWLLSKEFALMLFKSVRCSSFLKSSSNGFETGELSSKHQANEFRFWFRFPRVTIGFDQV